MIRTLAEPSALLLRTIGNRYPQIRRAFIFGSFAQGEQNPQSDLDVLLELDAPMGLQYLTLVQELEQAAGTPVDVITLRQAEVLESRFGYRIKEQARIVYDRTTN